MAAEGYRQEYYPLILPHLCFNRYDVAEGVRYYSLDTWKLVLKTSGPAEVAKHIDEVSIDWPSTNRLTISEIWQTSGQG